MAKFLGRVLKSNRIKRGFTNVGEFAAKVGVNKSYYYEIEAGKNTSIKTLAQIAAVLEIPLSQIFKEVEELEENEKEGE